MMTRKDYERAAGIARNYFRTAKKLPKGRLKEDTVCIAMAVVGAYVELFQTESNFDEKRFRDACEKTDESLRTETFHRESANSSIRDTQEGSWRKHTSKRAKGCLGN